MRKVTAAVLVCFVLFAGGAAASGFLITSVNQIKPSVRKALQGNRGPRGFRGFRGAGASILVTTIQGPVAGMTPFGTATDVGSSVATCPAGGVVLGGGWDGGSNPPVDASAAYNEAIGGGSWEVIMANNGPLTATVSAVAVCATGPGSQARRELSRSAIRATVARQVAALRTRTK